MGDFTPINLFVYGTLMMGYGNHRLLESSVFLGKAVTCEKYAMFVNTFPFVNPNHPRAKIHGEVYQVTTEADLKALDRLEGHPDWYIRKEIMVTFTELQASGAEHFHVGENIPAFIYFNGFVDDTENSTVECNYVPSGNFRDV
jgi:gamma-glutamylcyclotransferase (GGCT)/AIG2-like uncharacterized protein YtfP